jgi:hypothetical protein
MHRGSHLQSEIDRLAQEVDIVRQSLVLPGWLGPQHGLPDALYGYIMGLFARVDLMSAYWRGSFANQSVRMVDFLSHFMQPDRTINSILIQVWRHKLMHTASPREVRDPDAGRTYRWLLHWGDEHLPRNQHLTFQQNGENLNMTLTGLIAGVQQAAVLYVQALNISQELAANYDAVEHELNNYKFRQL